MPATVRLHPIRTGELLAPPQLLERVPGPFATVRALGLGVPKAQRVWLPVPAFLIEHPGHGPVLVDTGLPAMAATDAAGGISRIADRLYEVRMTPDDGIAAQVRARGVDPAAIEHVVMTHLHFDHAAGMVEIPNATFVVSDEEWRTAGSPVSALLGGYHRPHYAGRPRRAPDPSGAERWGAFERTYDLFGDGAVRLLFTPGHSAGHCSVAVRTERGDVILAGDVAYTRSAVYGDAEPGLRADAGLLRASLAQLRRHVREHPETLVIPGHDAEAWAELDAVY